MSNSLSTYFLLQLDSNKRMFKQRTQPHPSPIYKRCYHLIKSPALRLFIFYEHTTPLKTLSVHRPVTTQPLPLHSEQPLF